MNISTSRLAIYFYLEGSIASLKDNINYGTNTNDHPCIVIDY